MSLKNKAVLISIRPEWCEKILNGEKTVEIRKNRPSLKMPFKCYIYCTKPVGNVIGEFTCDKIRFYFGKSWLVKEDIEDVTAGSCPWNKSKNMPAGEKLHLLWTVKICMRGTSPT